MSDQTHGIKETKEAALGAIALGFYIAKLSKDGLDFADLGAFMSKLQNDAVFAEKLKAAYEGADKIPQEIGELSLAEGLELAGAIVPAVIQEFGAP